MDIEKYTTIKADDIHKRLITDILLNIEDAGELLDKLTGTVRYKEDYVGRAWVDNPMVYLDSLRGAQSAVIKICR